MCKVIKSLRDFISKGVVSGKNLSEMILEAHVDLDQREKDVVLAGELLEFLKLQWD